MYIKLTLDKYDEKVSVEIKKNSNIITYTKCNLFY